MENRLINRRQLLRAAGTLGALGTVLLENQDTAAAAPILDKTPGLTNDEMMAFETAMGKKGTYSVFQSTYSVSLPRNDLQMTIKGESIPSSFGFVGRVSVKHTLDGKSAVLISEAVLLQEEVNGLISAVTKNGLGVSAIHHRFFYEEPRVFYMHIHGRGRPEDVINQYAAAIKATKLFPANQPPANLSPARNARETFDIPTLNDVLKNRASVDGPTLKYTFGRDDLNVVAMNARIGSALGLKSWAAFAGDKEKAHIAGAFALLEPEITWVLEALQSNNIEVVSVQPHMLGEEPRITFVNYYGTGPAIKLAQGLRVALNELGMHGKTMDIFSR